MGIPRRGSGYHLALKSPGEQTLLTDTRENQGHGGRSPFLGGDGGDQHGLAVSHQEVLSLYSSNGVRVTGWPNPQRPNKLPDGMTEVMTGGTEHKNIISQHQSPWLSHWSLGQQPQRHLGTCEECKFLGPSQTH